MTQNCQSPICLSSAPSTIQVVRTDLSGAVLGTFTFGGAGFSAPYAAAVDNAGNLVISGTTISPDFPLVSRLQATGGAFITKIDPQLHGIVYSTRFGSGPGLAAGINALAFDAQNNLYLTGVTSGGLRATPDAFQQHGCLSTSADSAFVAEIDATGAHLLFATFYDGTLPSSIQGNVIVSRPTTDNVPDTPGAYSKAAPTTALGPSVGFVAKFIWTWPKPNTEAAAHSPLSVVA